MKKQTSKFLKNLRIPENSPKSYRHSILMGINITGRISKTVMRKLKLIPLYERTYKKYDKKEEKATQRKIFDRNINQEGTG
jgi:hypothetical protein